MDTKQKSRALADKIYRLKSEYRNIRNVLHMHKDILDSDHQREYENEIRSMGEGPHPHGYPRHHHQDQDLKPEEEKEQDKKTSTVTDNYEARTRSWVTTTKTQKMTMPRISRDHSEAKTSTVAKPNFLA